MIARSICDNLWYPCIKHCTQIYTDLQGSVRTFHVIAHSICGNLWDPCADCCAQIYTDLHDSVRMRSPFAHSICKICGIRVLIITHRSTQINIEA